MFQSRICDDISLAISPDKLFRMLLKKLSLLACERKLQDFDLSRSEELCNASNTHYFSWLFTYIAKDSCYMGEKRFA